MTNTEAYEHWLSLMADGRYLEAHEFIKQNAELRQTRLEQKSWVNSMCDDISSYLYETRFRKQHIR